MKLITDPALLQQLNAGSAGLKPVTDPELLKQLETGESQPYEGWGEYLKDLGRTAAQGLTVNTSDEAIAWLRSLGGTPYDQAAQEESDALKRFSEINPKTALAAQLAGGLAMPGAGALGVALRAPTLLGRVARGTGVGTGIGGVAGFGAGEGGFEERLESAMGGATGGAAIGAAIPVAGAALSPLARALYDKLSPQATRMSAQAKQYLKDKYGMSFSADGGIPVNVGAEAAAEQIAANQLLRAGRTAPELMNQLDEAEVARRFHTNSYGANVLAPVDLDSSLQRLAGSAVRASPEAGNRAQTFLQARQTGASPAEGPLPVSTGLPTRPAFSPPITGEQAEKLHGTTYGTAQDRLVPMGQYERVRDALKRSMLLIDEKFHGHGPNAYRTEQQIMTAAKEEAKELYSKTYIAGRNIDLRPTIQPVLQKWADVASGEPLPVQHEVKKALELFTSGKGNVVNSIERFDKAKQFLDGEIDRLFNSEASRNRYMGGVLTDMKNELLAAVDNIKINDMGEAYKAARGAFGSQMQARDALRLGREVFKESSDVTADVFKSLESEADRKLFRLGLLESFETRMKDIGLNRDVTPLFNTPRVQEILREVIPRREALGEFRPENFGRYLANERRMVETRNEVLGNSKTAQRLADDEAYENLNVVSEAVNKLRQSGSILNVGIAVVEGSLNKLFGMRSDTAKVLTDWLFTADPGRRRLFLERVQQRMGPSRFDQLARLMEHVGQSATPVSANMMGAAAGG